MSFTRLMFFMLALALSTTAGAETAKQKECRGRVADAAEGGFVLGLDSGSRGTEVVVHEGAWRQTNYSTKVGLAETVSCMLTKEGEQARIVVLSNRTNKVLAEGYPGNFKIK